MDNFPVFPIFRKLLTYYCKRIFIIDRFFTLLGTLFFIIFSTFCIANLYISFSKNFLLILLTQFSCIIVFIFPFYFTLLNYNKFFKETFSPLFTSNEKQDCLHKNYLSLSVSLMFCRCLIFVFFWLILLWGTSFIFLESALLKSNFFTIFITSLFGCVFWFFFGIIFKFLLPSKVVLPFVQFFSLIFIFGGGYIFPSVTFNANFETLTQVLPSRCIGDILFYSFLGLKSPGGAIVTFGEFFAVFACFFILILKYCKSNNKVLY